MRSGTVRGLLAAAWRTAGRASRSAAESSSAEPPWACRQALRSAWSDARGYEHFEGRGPGWRRAKLQWWAVGAAAAGGFYYVRSIEEVPYTHRRHAIMFVSQQSELAMGQQVFDQTLQEARAAGRLLPPSHPYAQLVTEVGRRVAAVACDGEGGGYQDHMRNLKWQFAVVDSPQVNAFVAPGGKVVVFTGLLKIMRSEDELAAVIAHEAAHVLARHPAERMSQANVLGLATLFVNWFLGIPLSPNLLVLGFFLPHSRASESEADAIGIRLLARSCYDPAANVTMLQRLAAAEAANGDGGGGGALGALVRTHPLTQERVQRVKELLPEAYATYRERCSALRGAWGGGVFG